MARPTRTASRAPRPRAKAPAPPERAERTPPFFMTKLTVDETAFGVPMLVLRGDWLKAVGFPTGATALMTTDKQGDITLTRLGLRRPRRIRVVKSPP